MKKYIFLPILFFGILNLSAQLPNRNALLIPDIPGFVSLKCDFHMHTVFSDGSVWPDVRVGEAYKEGLDAISITDHIEYLPHKKDVNPDLNRPFEIAKKAAERADIILIKGIELTRSMPPGHLNAIFIKDAEKMDTASYIDALVEAKNQDAFVFWNHPGWKAQAPDGIKWYEEHTELYDKDLFNGIEVVNFDEYYPEAFKWCIGKDLALLSNSDKHDPFAVNYEKKPFYHRPVTIVFAKERTAESIKEALENRRSAAWFEKNVIGKEVFLKELALASIRLHKPHYSGKEDFSRKMTNHSSFYFHFKTGGKDYKINPFSEIIISGNRSAEWNIEIDNFITENGALKIVM